MKIELLIMKLYIARFLWIFESSSNEEETFDVRDN